jgi:DNA-3-methyladenine glycosylase I
MPRKQGIRSDPASFEEIALEVIPVTDPERDWMRGILSERWGSPHVYRRGMSDDASMLPGFIAVEEGRRLGLVTYRLETNECEVVTLDALRQWSGVGTALLRAVENEAARGGCRRVWLVTTNDNLDALRFYQRRGYEIAEVGRGAVDETRRLHKPSITAIGAYDIPIRDEIVVEKLLRSRPNRG